MTAPITLALAACIGFMLGAVLMMLTEPPKPAPAPDPYRAAMAIFDRMEAEAKARVCTSDVNCYRRARRAFAQQCIAGSIAKSSENLVMERAG